MNYNSITRIAFSLVLYLSASQLSMAVKIVVPEQYKDQVDAIKAADQKARGRELDGLTGEAGHSESSDSSTHKPVVDADAFLVQSVVEATDTAAEYEGSLDANQGMVSGQIVDKETGAPLAGVAILVEGADVATVTDDDGRYSLGPVSAGQHTLSFVKTGYIEANVTEYDVAGGEVSVFPFALPPRPAAMSDDVYELQDFTVTAEQANQLMSNIELRMDSDKMLNLFSSEDFSKFAAGDVADALKRVSGVNIVEGQFAVIRGLEDRYSSTTYNGAPVPSPDPDSQSVQLDLFPSEVVTNLEIAKTFAGDLPSNSSGGSINIVTHDYPDEPLQIKVKAGTGYEENAHERFLEYDDGSPIGKEVGGSDVIESDFSVFVGGRTDWKERELRYKVSLSNEIDYSTAVGTVETRGANPQFDIRDAFPNPPGFSNLPQVVQDNLLSLNPLRDGDLAAGQLNQTGGRFDQTKSERSEQTAIYAGLGIDLDEEGRHQLDGSYFYTDKEEAVVQLRENGRVPSTAMGSFFSPVSDTDPNLNFNKLSISDPNGAAGALALPGTWLVNDVRTNTLDVAAPGHGFYAPVFESLSQSRERELEVLQLNGNHQLSDEPGLSISWAVNQAETNQSEQTQRMKYVFDINNSSDPILKDLLTAVGDPTTALELLSVEQVRELEAALQNAGRNANAEYIANDISINDVEVEETQDFARVDLHLDHPLSDNLNLKFDAGFYTENAQRSVAASFLESPTIGGVGQNIDNVGAESAGDLWDQIFQNLDRNADGFSGLRTSSNDSERDVQAVHFKTKLEISKRWEVLAGVRLEDISLSSDNEPFYSDGGSFKAFPNFTILESVLGMPLNSLKDPNLANPSLPEAEIRQLVDGRIESEEFLPSLGFNYKPMDGLSFRLAWSQTVARPSFREMGYYATVEPGTSDLVVGNPSLQLSDVESWDARAEYSWGNVGDLIAVSLFKKSIDDPIEKFTFRNRQNFEEAQLINSFFNNETTADLRGVEFEFQKNLGFIQSDSWLQYFSLGGNFTYIEATVDRSERELANTGNFYDVDDTMRMDESRRLFGQPEWISNLNITFDQPEWGTNVTLAFFAISDILNSAGVVSPAVNGDIITYTPDRYTGSFHQVDLIIRQKWKDWTFGFSVKNLTDSERSLEYDSEVVGGGSQEQSYKVGRDYSISASYTF